MKGVVFTELFSFVENQYSPEFMQDVINKSDVKSRGVYTATGTYPTCEMGALLSSLAKKTGHDVSHLLKIFGEHLFNYFFTTSPHFFEGVNTAFDFLESVETHIHVDVKKLYPDAELPSFKVLEHTETRFVIIYESTRDLGDLCEGLIKGCLDHFDVDATITRRPIRTNPISSTEFTLEV